MNLPTTLVEDARRGRLVLLLGAGASLGATTPGGTSPPLSNELRDMLADRFLGGKCKDESLAWVAELAISETDLVTVQDYIAEILRDLEPADFHRLLPTFRWRGIATTNYDLVLETTYSRSGNDKVQHLVPFISDQDRVDDKLRLPNSVAFLKLHGCITRTQDKALPLILTADQYVTHRNGRRRLFRILEDWAYENPIIFVGSGGQDHDLRKLLLEVSSSHVSRPRYYLVKPRATEEEQRFWETKSITILDGTFKELLEQLDHDLPKEKRPLLKVIQSAHPISRHFCVKEEIGGVLAAFLDTDVEYVHTSIAAPSGTAHAFYKGFDLGWYPILHNFDVRRRLTDTILNDVIIRSEEDRLSISELFLIRAEAGAGKSVFLRRLAWESARDADAICLYAHPYGILKAEPFKELHRVTRQRIFLFVDNAAERVASIARLIADARRDYIPLTVFTAERGNTWNMTCERLVPLLTEAYTLRYLSHPEIETLVTLLRNSDSLGPNLTGKPAAECIRQFEEQAGRQLLVALHEATLGLPFEEILIDEYHKIQPATARQLYLTVCVLNRLGVYVRAGLISRIHDIPFEKFRSTLFSPLEHVVNVQKDTVVQDYYYSARHPEIAQIVFDKILGSPEDRYNEYVRILQQLNISYNSDRTAFRGLVRAKSLHELFPDHHNVEAIFDIATDIAERDSYLLQQRANYERIRPSGDFARAALLLQEAIELDPRDSSLVHTLAEINFAHAVRATHLLEREKYRNECRSLLRPLLMDSQNDRYARHTLVKVAIHELKDILNTADSTDRQIDEAIRSIDNLLRTGLQQYPEDHLLLVAEADLRQLLNDDERVINALKKAFKVNSRDPYIASRLSRLYEDSGNLAGAKDTIQQALEGNRADKELNFRYAMLLRKANPADHSVLLYHLKRSFTKWDNNYEAQFWFARYAFEDSSEKTRQESKEAFGHLRNSPLAHDIRINVRDSICDVDGQNKLFYGKIVRLEYQYGFIERDGLGDWIFFHRKDALAGLSMHMRVRFELGFTFNGPTALAVKTL